MEGHNFEVGVGRGICDTLPVSVQHLTVFQPTRNSQPDFSADLAGGFPSVCALTDHVCVFLCVQCLIVPSC